MLGYLFKVDGSNSFFVSVIFSFSLGDCIPGEKTDPEPEVQVFFKEKY